MIPKIIHYCWFGRGKMPQQAEQCLASWQKFLPDYQIMRWDEESYDFSRLAFTREAYAQRKFAFVTDVVRLEALYRYGGVYMDTDVEILRPLDDALLSLPGFTGFES
ncbi:MAG: glycosyltransferase, partial [Alistipes sp.]|nr:glycosyltransferase [Alistipes sp.]